VCLRVGLHHATVFCFFSFWCSFTVVCGELVNAAGGADHVSACLCSKVVLLLHCVADAFESKYHHMLQLQAEHQS
jgi:hypothetical protein